ncbi:hypothetical protein ACWCRF_36870, partial [Streptomyces sp. NPDC002405]
AHGGHVPERTWRQRLERMRSYPSKKQVAQFVAPTRTGSATHVRQGDRSWAWESRCPKLNAFDSVASAERVISVANG